MKMNSTGNDIRILVEPEGLENNSIGIAFGHLTPSRRRVFWRDRERGHSLQTGFHNMLTNLFFIF